MERNWTERFKTPGRSPLFLLTLPVFFTLHRYLVYAGMVSVRDAFLTVLELIAYTLLVFLLTRLLCKDTVKAALITATLLAFHLFFGEVRSALAATSAMGWLARYKFFLPLSGIILFLAIRMIWKAKNHARLVSVLNLVLIAWILIDLIMAWTDRSGSGTDLYAIQQKDPDGAPLIELPATAARPNVYYLVFDSHPSVEFLQGIGIPDSIRLDSNLIVRGFQWAKDPRSNYDKTPLSISSTFNLGYVAGVQAGARVTPKTYTEALHDIDHAKVPDWFVRSGYRFVNLSMFRMRGKDPIWKEGFLELPAKDLLMHPSFIASVKRDLLWAWMPVDEKQEDGTSARFLPLKAYNQAVLDSLATIRSIPATDPRFVYAHFYLPHPPYFFTEAGEPISLDSALTKPALSDRRKFLAYLRYTDRKMLELVDAITTSDPTAAIIIQSDHGFRDLNMKLAPETRHMNILAVKLPGKTVKGLDGLTNINTFPVVLNELFGLNWSRKKDSLVITR